MRLNRLDLTRYGKFTGHCIDFGTPAPGKPDLHIIYGPNEAGKSTTLSAFLDLLFGIETRSRFNFLHPHDTMRVGGSLEIGGTNYELARVKRARNTLLDANGQPIAEAVLTGQLGSIDRESYRAMFSLDDDTLEAGGESIMASKGDLGQLLFSASTGLAELSRILAELRAEADGFYRYHAHNTQLAIYKNRLAALKDQREQIDTVASRYAALVEARDLAKQQYDAAIADRTRIQARMDAIQRHASALPRLAALHALRAQLQPLADLPAAPAEWHDALPALQTEATTLAVRREGLERDHAEASAALAAIVVDEAAFAAASRLDHLNDLLARYVTAGKDIPVRALEVRQADLQIAGILGRLGRVDESDPQRLVLPAATTGTLRKLIEQYSGIETARETADREVREARQRLQEAREALQPATGTGGTDTGIGTDTGSGTASVTEVALDAAHLVALTAAVAGVHGADFAVRRRSAQRAQLIQRDVLAERLRSLLPWQGDAEQLAALAVPDETDLPLWQAELTTAHQQHARREQELERATAEHARLSAERDAIVRLAGVVSDHDAAEIRAVREAAWASHRRTLDAASADNFEAALRRDDRVMDARLHHEAAAVRLQQNGEALARAEADLRHAQEEFGKAALRLERVEARISAAAASCLPHATLDSLKAWLGRRDKALEARAALRQADHDLREADEDATDLRRRLLAALSAAGIPHDPAATLDMARAAAQAVLDREATVKALRDAVQDRRHELQVRDRRFKAAAERQEAWRGEWEAACAGCWLGASGTAPAVGAVQEMLTAIAELAPALERRASLLDRICKMQDDQRDFAAEVAAVAQAMGMDADDGDSLELARTITNEFGEAHATALRASKAEALETVQVRRRVLAEAQRIHDARLQAMQSFFGVNSLADVAARLSDIARRTGLQRQADDAVREILDALRTGSIDDAERQLAGADRAALEAELATLQARFADQDQRTRDLFSDCSKASDQVDRVGGDAAVARIDEQRRTVLLEIEEQAMRYLRLRAGIVAAEHALRSYRQQHRSAMMEEASRAFRTISRGAYSGLASQPNKDSEDLIAVGADGSSRQAAQLSKGTRFQLYLALRFAGYCEFARLRPPVPFVADDILETFDNERAEQALRLLAGIGQVGQAIYLTHHRHLCEIARQVCPDVRVHAL